MPVNSWAAMMQQAEQESKNTGFVPLDNQVYNFVIKEAAEVGQTQKGYPKFTFYAYVEDGPRKDARIRHTFSVNDNGWAMNNHFFKPLAILGLGVDFFTKEPSPDQIAAALQGRRFVGEVGDSDRKVEGSEPAQFYKELKGFYPAAAQPQVGVPTGLTAAPTAPVAPAAPAAPSPWDNATQAAPVAPQAPSAPAWGSTPPPPPFGAH